MKDSISHWNSCLPRRIKFYSSILVPVLFFLRKTVNNPCPNHTASNFFGKSILTSSVIFLSGICTPLSNQMLTLVQNTPFTYLPGFVTFPVLNRLYVILARPSPVPPIYMRQVRLPKVQERGLIKRSALAQPVAVIIRQRWKPCSMYLTAMCLDGDPQTTSK